MMPQQVDPFIPISRPQPRSTTATPQPLQGQYGQHLFKRKATASRVPKPRPRPSAVIDDIKPTGRAPRRPVYDQRLREAPMSRRSTGPDIITPPKRAVVQQRAEAPIAPPLATPQKPESRAKRLMHRQELPLFLLAAVAVGLLVQSLIFGEILIAAYAVYALLRRVASRTTFLLAMLTIACIVVLLVVRSNNTLAAHFAVYAFLLLAVGTITLGREIRQES